MEKYSNDVEIGDLVDEFDNEKKIIKEIEKEIRKENTRNDIELINNYYKIWSK